MHSIKEEAFRMKECLLRGDLHSLHAVLRASWESKKRMARQITNEQIERLYACALDAGAHCAKISGAGGGGFMWLLADPIHKDKVTAALHAAHAGGTVYGCHFTASGVQAWRVP
jgi:D-glycero-alpha-D-manno-heptose-7-phosphate kinase